MSNQNRQYDKRTQSSKSSTKRRVYYHRPTSKVNKKNTHRNEQLESVKISFLGGMNEIGKNMTLYQFRNDMFLVDCGLAFPDAELPGVDLVIPDFTYVEENKKFIKGIIITHGHEDHIGGLAYLLKKVNIPIYAPQAYP